MTRPSSRRRLFRRVAALAGATLGLWSSHALAARPQKAAYADRNAGYYAAHLGATAGLTTLALIAGGQTPEGEHDEPLAARSLSNALFTLELVLPVPALASHADGMIFVNALVINGETLAAGALAANLWRIPYGKPGHSVVAFASAVTNSYLFAERGKSEPAVRSGYWGLELGLATTSMLLEVASSHRACDRGERLRDAKSCHTTDWGIAAQGIGGAVLGSAIGAAAIGVHGGSLALRQSDTVGILSGIGIGTALGLIGYFHTDPLGIPAVIVPLSGDGPGVSVSAVW